MINTKHGDTSIVGRTEELCADFTCITNVLNEAFSKTYGKEEAKKLLEDAFRDGFKSEDELTKEIINELMKLVTGEKDEEEKILEIIKALKETGKEEQGWKK